MAIVFPLQLLIEVLFRNCSVSILLKDIQEKHSRDTWEGGVVNFDKYLKKLYFSGDWEWLYLEHRDWPNADKFGKHESKKTGTCQSYAYPPPH